MSKGKFEPGKWVWLIRGISPWAKKYNETLQKLESVAYNDEDGTNWFVVGINDQTQSGLRCVWMQKCMIPIDPDESPEQSIEAMRNLMQTKKEKVTT